MNPERYLDSLLNYEKIPGYNYDLNAFRRFCEQIGSPHMQLKNVIHIAGTKGKGSVTALLSSCLMAHGYRVGIFTSPHLARVNERIKVNTQEISNSRLSGYLRKIRSRLDLLPGTRTYFEVLTACAFLHFAKSRTDFNILEVGLGGRLDSTNVTAPLISVITRIGYDHTHLLGNTLGEISREKAGIIKRRTSVVTIRQRPAAASVIRQAAQSQQAHLVFADDEHSIKITGRRLQASRIEVRGVLGRFAGVLPLPGDHQVENLALCLSVLNQLKHDGFPMDKHLVQRGLRQVKLRGRFEVISKKPLIIFDCAHNEDSFKALDDHLRHMGITRYFLIFGTNHGKNIRYCLKHTFPRAHAVCLVPTSNPRSIDPIELQRYARPYQKRLIIAGSVARALDYVRSQKCRIPVIITGSFFLWQSDWQ